MPPKKHVKNALSDQPQLKNYLQQNEYYSTSQIMTQGDVKQKMSSLEYLNMQIKVDNFLKKTPTKPLYSIAPPLKKPLLKSQKSSNQLRSNQASTQREESTLLSKMFNGVQSPKQQTSSGQNVSRPESSHFKTQPQSLQASMTKIDSLKQISERNSMGKHFRFKLNIRNGSEDLRQSNPDVMKSTKVGDMKSSKSNSTKSQSQVLLEKGQKSESQMTVLLQYKGKLYKYSIEPSKHDVGWLIDFLQKELERVDPNQKGVFLGVKTTTFSVPVDYLLSLKSLAVKTIYDFQAQLVVEPIYQVPRDNKKVSLRDFDFIKCIGHGGFSQVYLVRDRTKGQYYAMKLVLKNHIIGQGKQSIIQSERDIMAQMEHPFLIKMHYAFESRKYLVFVLEYCQGGELFYLLRKVKRMSEEEAFFYFSEICLGMKHLHDNHIVYRDIKPENILIDFDGHVRIADFGLSKPQMGDSDVAYSFCGSPEYMAPEMLLKSGHSFQLDLYCLGALLYELITGLPPYYSRNTDEIYHRILNAKLAFPNSVKMSAPLKELLTALLVKNPQKRISDMNGVLQHPWIKQFGGEHTLQLLKQKYIDPPFKPDPYRYNFDEQEFGQGEKQFLADMRSIQEQHQENNPTQCVLPDFYYNSGKKQIEGEVLKDLERYMTTRMSPQHSTQKSDMAGGQFSQRSTHHRMNTFDDTFGGRTIHQKKQSLQLRLQTEKQ